MHRSEDSAVDLVRVCLDKSGFNRNCQRILEAIEEEIFGSGAAQNADEFESVEDYAKMTYPFARFWDFDIIRDGTVNTNIDGDFSQREIELLDAMSTDGVLEIHTNRMEGAKHNFTFLMIVPTAHINLNSEKITLIVELNGVRWEECTYEIQANQIDGDCDSARLEKLTTLIAMS